MPTYKQRTILALARDIKAFLSLEIGLVRGNTSTFSGGTDTELERVREQLKSVRGQLTRKEQELTKLKAGIAGNTGAREINPENMIWIFGTGRSGSTWLRSMMAEMQGHVVWEEPMVGKLFGRFYNGAQTGQLASSKFILGDPTRDQWIKSIRNFVLDGARYANPQLQPEQYLVIKEPNGSDGAPLIMESLPESRMIFLIRDPRDVVASVLDGARQGSWLHGRKDEWVWKATRPDEQPNSFVKHRARMYMRDVEGARKAYEAHEEPKVMVRYEDLRSDTLGTMERIYKTLGIAADERELARVVDKHAWENIPESEKGEGKFYRKASPGGWREDLSPEQVEIVEKITAPLLNQFYSM